MTLPLTVAVKIAVRGISREQWGWFCDHGRNGHMSHLNGIAGDINPLNYHSEAGDVSLGRKKYYNPMN